MAATLDWRGSAVKLSWNHHWLSPCFTLPSDAEAAPSWTGLNPTNATTDRESDTSLAGQFD